MNQRPREEIEATIKAMDYADYEPWQILQVEIGLDCRDLLTEIRDALKRPSAGRAISDQWSPPEVSRMFDEAISEQLPANDELYEEAKRHIELLARGAIVPPGIFMENLSMSISYARSSALREALLEAGVLRKQEGTGRYLVV